MSALVLDDRFWSKVDKESSPIGCWLWTAALVSNGYGRFSVGRKTMLAHRVSLLGAGAVIPDGMMVCHRCDVRNCVNPEHLFVATQQENMDDCKQKGRTAKGIATGRYTHPERTARGDRHGFRLHPECAPRGEHNGNSKLTADDVKNIRSLYRSGDFTQKQLGKRYGVTQVMVSAIVLNKFWKQVE